MPPETVREESVVAPAVTEPKVAPPVALNWPVTVVEPVTASADDVADVKVAPAKVARPVWVVAPKVAPPRALNWPVTVVEPVSARLVPVALVKVMFWKALVPLHVLVSERSVVEANPESVAQVMLPEESVVRARVPEQAPKFPASVVEPVELTLKSVVVAVPADEEPIEKRMDEA